MSTGGGGLGWLKFAMRHGDVGWRRSTGVEDRRRRRAAAGGGGSGEWRWRGRVGDASWIMMDGDTQVTRVSHDTMKL